MNSRPEQLGDRTKNFALRIIRLFRSLPYKTDTQVLGKLLLRCGTSVAANYRAIYRARVEGGVYRSDGNCRGRGGRSSALAGTPDLIRDYKIGNDVRAPERSSRTGGDTDGLAANGEKDSVTGFQLLNYQIIQSLNFPCLT